VHLRPDRAGAFCLAGSGSRTLTFIRAPPFREQNPQRQSALSANRSAVAPDRAFIDAAGFFRRPEKPYRGRPRLRPRRTSVYPAARQETGWGGSDLS